MIPECEDEGDEWWRLIDVSKLENLFVEVPADSFCMERVKKTVPVFRERLSNHGIKNHGNKVPSSLALWNMLMRESDVFWSFRYTRKQMASSER